MRNKNNGKCQIVFSLLGLIIGLIGVIGTYLPIFGNKLLWIGIIILGFLILFFYSLKQVIIWRNTVKTFGKRWRIEDGKLIIGNTVNVALRIHTIQKLLEFFKYRIENDFNKFLKEIGREIGRDFAKDLKKELRQSGNSIIDRTGLEINIIREKIALWAEYDSSTGMGIFNIDNLEVEVGGIRGEIALKNSFLAQDVEFESEDIKCCAFISGYIEGVIEKLVGIPVIVEEIECFVQNKKKCIFKVKQK